MMETWFPPLPGDQPNETGNIPIGQTEDETPAPEETTSSEWCVIVPDGTDTDGTEWSRCTVHNRLTLTYVCEGYQAPPYVDMVAVRAWLDTAPEGVVSVQVDLANGTSETVVLKED